MRAVHIVIFPASIFKSASARSNAVTGLMDFIVVKQGLLFRVLFLCSEEHPEINPGKFRDQAFGLSGFRPVRF